MAEALERWPAATRRVFPCVQTLADMAGANTPHDWDGKSVLHWMDHGSTAWKDQAVTEYCAHNAASAYVMLRLREWKYVYHTVIDKDHAAERELYNLISHPGEFRNLTNLPEHAARIADMHKAMVEEVGGDRDETEQPSQAELSRGYNRTDSPTPGSVQFSLE